MKGQIKLSRKHFDDYYNKICSQFFSLNKVFDDLSKEVAEGMVEPERLEQLKVTIQPIKDSYQTLSYIKYLLDQPQKRRKQPRYKDMNKKLLKISEGHQAEDVLNNNKQILDSLKN